MLEDTKDKVRRNLVVFAAFMMLSNFLAIDIIITANKLLEQFGLKIDHDRAKIIVPIIFAYLLYRFLSSDSFQTDLSKLWKDIANTLGGKITSFRLKAVEAALYDPEGNKKSVTLPLSDTLLKFDELVKIVQLSIIVPPTAVDKGILRQFSRDFEYVCSIHMQDPRTHPIYTQMFSYGSVTNYSNSGQHQIELNVKIFIPWAQKARMSLQTVYKTVFSQEFSEAIVPMIIALIALIY